MVIRNLNASEINRFNVKKADSDIIYYNTDENFLNKPINFQEEMSDAAEEIADLISMFGRFSKSGRKNDHADNDFLSSMLEEKADDKFNTLVRQVSKMSDLSTLLNFTRALFPDDCDLMLALKELLLSRKLSEIQKRKVKEAIADLGKFASQQKMQSGVNVGFLAKRFSEDSEDKSLSAMDLRNCYLCFLELGHIPAGIIYQDWINIYGCHNRKRLLAFTHSALITDMKANEPGIHFYEFGPLAEKLSSARLLHSLDNLICDNFSGLPFREQMRNGKVMLDEKNIVSLYITGLVDANNLKNTFQLFSSEFMNLLMIKQRAIVVQMMKNVFNETPDFLFSDVSYRDLVLDITSAILSQMHEKEIRTGIWSEFKHNGHYQ